MKYYNLFRFTSVRKFYTTDNGGFKADTYMSTNTRINLECCNAITIGVLKDTMTKKDLYLRVTFAFDNYYFECDYNGPADNRESIVRQLDNFIQ